MIKAIIDIILVFIVIQNIKYQFLLKNLIKSSFIGHYTINFYFYRKVFPIVLILLITLKLRFRMFKKIFYFSTFGPFIELLS